MPRELDENVAIRRIYVEVAELTRYAYLKIHGKIDEWIAGPYLRREDVLAIIRQYIPKDWQKTVDKHAKIDQWWSPEKKDQDGDKSPEEGDK